jgi:dihydropteroate synthase
LIADTRRRCRVMGVLNVTPDSFSDGGRHEAPDQALQHARRLIAEGADILDVGGASSRPGATPVAAQEELARIAPVIRATCSESRVPISVDTARPDVARECVRAGADMWNDITALRGAPDSPAIAAELGCEVVLMHMRGTPATMGSLTHYDDVVTEVRDFLAERAEIAMAAGVRREAIWIDPGLGFAKTAEHNLALLRELPRLTELGFPVLIGASRKRWIARIAADDGVEDRRLGGSIAAALAAARGGAAAVRVHDVAETVQALAICHAIEGA